MRKRAAGPIRLPDFSLSRQIVLIDSDNVIASISKLDDVVRRIPFVLLQQRFARTVKVARIDDSATHNRLAKE